MEYRKIKPQNMTEMELRALWKSEYCDSGRLIQTFDNVKVRFHEKMFNHAFYESSDRKAGDKSILSLNRLEKMLWIKAVLSDPEAVLKQGWDKNTKSYDNSRRVAVIKGSYIVVIRLTGPLMASFVTAYELTDDKQNNRRILDSPDWIKDERFLGKA
jgi:hypothetical protein